jgi:hypothetical protein
MCDVEERAVSARMLLKEVVRACENHCLVTGGQNVASCFSPFYRANPFITRYYVGDILSEKIHERMRYVKV